jgi:hypothetical protein
MQLLKGFVVDNARRQLLFAANPSSRHVFVADKSISVAALYRLHQLRLIFTTANKDKCVEYMLSIAEIPLTAT